MQFKFEPWKDDDFALEEVTDAPELEGLSS